MGCLILWSGATHMYFIAFLGMLIFLFWLFFAFTRPETFGKWKTWLPHLLIQLIVPVIIIQWLAHISSNALDRGQYPYGFLYYRAYAESVFLPADRHYGAFLHKIIHYNYINWEGFAYIGAVATIGCAIFFGRVIPRLVKGRFRTGWMYDNNLFLTYLFWGTFLILLYSFGVPFIFGLEGIVDYIGPIRQIRGLGRFAWVFYYGMNILAVYSIWNYSRTRKKKIMQLLLLSFTFLILLTEAHLNMKFIYPFLNKKNPEFIDFKNTLPSDDWVKQIESSKYQSILTLPYFHIGSENIWLEAACGIDAEVFNVSLKTGLPTHAVLMGRTSLSQTYKALELIWEPYRVPAILNDLHSSKPILVLSATCDQLGPGEKLILQHTRHITSPAQWYNLGEISPDTLRMLAGEHARALYASKDHSAVFDGKKFTMPDSTANYLYLNYSGMSADSGYLNPGTKVMTWKTHTRFFSEKMPENIAPGDVTISFWVKNIKDDNMPRMELEVLNLDANQKVTRYDRSILSRWLKQLDGSWGLIEFNIPVAAGESVALSMFPGKIKKDITIDDLLIRKAGTDIYGVMAGKGWVLNNRLYPAGLLK